jgi:hypothetical protein
MAWSSIQFSARPFSSGARPVRPTEATIVTAQSGWAAWIYSKTAKLNAWSWHGLGTEATAKINAWASLGNQMYLRRDSDTALHVMMADTFFMDSDTNTESLRVQADTQWLDFGKPGVLKSVTGLDFDGQNVTTVEVYVSVDGDRNGVLADSIAVGSDQSGWTYSGDILPVTAAGTEFKLKFICNPNTEAQINRLTLYYDDLGYS